MVFACGPHDGGADFESLPESMRGAHAARIPSALVPAADLEAVRPGDLVLVKGSLGSRMARRLSTPCLDLNGNRHAQRGQRVLVRSA